MADCALHGGVSLLIVPVSSDNGNWDALDRIKGVWSWTIPVSSYYVLIVQFPIPMNHFATYNYSPGTAVLFVSPPSASSTSFRCFRSACSASIAFVVLVQSVGHLFSCGRQCKTMDGYSVLCAVFLCIYGRLMKSVYFVQSRRSSLQFVVSPAHNFMRSLVSNYTQLQMQKRLVGEDLVIGSCLLWMLVSVADNCQNQICIVAEQWNVGLRLYLSPVPFVVKLFKAYVVVPRPSAYSLQVQLIFQM